MLLFIKLSHQRGIAHECFMRQHDVFMFLFIYLFLICLIQFLQKMRFWIWKSCTKCSWNKPTEMIQNANMQWLAVARMIQEEAILYFVDFFERGLFFYLHWIPHWPSQRHHCKSYLSDNCQALNSMNEQMLKIKIRLRTDTTKYKCLTVLIELNIVAAIINFLLLFNWVLLQKCSNATLAAKAL